MHPKIALALCAAPALALLLQETRSTDAPALAWGDFDADGLADLATIVPDGPLRLLRNLGDGSFEDVTAASGVAASGVRHAAFVDVDADGRLDLFLLGPDGRPALHRGLGDGAFEDATAACGLGGVAPATGARWSDYDGDGHVDVELTTATGVRLLHNDGRGALRESGHAWAAAPAGPDAAATAPTIPAVGPDAAGVPGSPGTATVDAARTAASGGTGAAASGATGVERGAPGAAGGRQPLGGFAPGVGGSSHGGGVVAGTSSGYCAAGIEDEAGTGFCIGASSEPTMNRLYPLSTELFVDTDGDVGMGTANPRSHLHVRGEGTEATLRLNTGQANGTSKLLLLENGNGENNLFGGVLAYDGGLDKLRIQMLSAGTAEDAMVINRSTGRIGVNTQNPVGRLHVVGADSLGSAFITPASTGTGNDSRLVLGEHHDANFGFAVRCDGGANELHFQGVNNGADTSHLTIGRDSGRVIVGGETGSGRFSVVSDHTGVNDAAVHTVNTSTAAGNALYAESNGTATTAIFEQRGTGNIIKGNLAGGTTVFRVSNTGRVVTSALEITGGGDLVEGFDSREDLPPGTVVAIDPEHPGELVATRAAYDTKVAGVVSGANGVNHGIRMGQDDVLDGDHLVAMAGRVWVRCTAENGPIRPGDLLTSAPSAGCAMRASDAGRSFGAVIGKAMSALEGEDGLVLVLVNLQ